LVKQVEDKVTLSKTVMMETEDEMRNLDKKQTDITKEIDHEVDEGIHMLEIRRRELKDTLKEKCKKKRSVLQSQREGLKYNLSLMTSAKEFSSHIMTHRQVFDTQ
jgi:5'(3')-deoxyribonucleotidase